ncbi:MAG: aldo/keto reductase [Clostridiaceae bacterium]|nr:aldo/keto reductase [Clostridiaceae bacterium]
MKYKVLGRSNLRVSVVGFGGIPVQRITIEEAANVIKKANEIGVNFIDTARGYTVSEQVIGNAVQGMREKWIIATKSMARDKETMKKDIEISLNNLKTDYIDLYQLHNVRTEEDYNKVLSGNGAYAALSEAVEEGKIKHIGITSHSLDILKLAVESGKFETIMYPYNMVENQGEELFKRANELNIGIIAMKPMAGGALNNGTLALKYILNNNNVTTAIPGMASIKEVIENCQAADSSLELDNKDKEEINKLIDELGGEFCRRCSYCAPCTVGIDIPSLFILQGYKERYNLAGWAEDRYKSTKIRAKDCIQCGVCETRCPYELPIRKMLEKVRKTFNE